MNSLDQMKSGDCAKITALDESNPNMVRLAGMGLVPGHEVRLIRRAPLGDPIQVRILHHELCLRKEDARSIFVESISPS